MPEALLDLDDDARRRCASLIVTERGASGKGDTVQLRFAKRSDAFKQSVADLLNSVTNVECTVGETVTIPTAALQDLDGAGSV
jgi:hypothetical protein